MGARAAASRGGQAAVPRRPRCCGAECLREAAEVWLAGVQDALKINRCLLLFIRCEVIRFRTLQCFMLNGVIFLGSIFLFSYVIEPALGMLRHLVSGGDLIAVDFIGASFTVLYKPLWIYPIYCISFVLNTVMYQDIADKALALVNQTPPNPTPPLQRLIEEAFRVLLNLVYMVEMNVLFYLPVVGPPLYFVHSCWLASIYCLEYRWAHLRWTSNARIDNFEQHWLYFAGFGFPVSFVSYLCPRFIDAGVFALLFPLFILTSTMADPKQLTAAPRLLRRLPVFMVAQGISCRALRVFEGCLAEAPPPAQAAPRRSSASKDAPAE